MKIAIITHVIHKKEQELYLGYGPYVREMNIWFRYVDTAIVVAPLGNIPVNAIDLAYEVPNLTFKQVPAFSLIGVKNKLKTLLLLPQIFVQIYRAMAAADHIHLRCPGNMGLLGAMVQILFPKKKKTAKYAGNWDPTSQQPWSYRLQRWILKNEFLTKNMQILVYGDWNDTSQNVKPFFTATYHESDKRPIQKRDLESEIRWLFVGTLSEGKRPLYVAQLATALMAKGFRIRLDFYGEGKMRSELEAYLDENPFKEKIKLHGNCTADEVKQALTEAHLMVLPSKSEGWPKVVAEAMFWGCVPAATAVSCVPYMLDQGERGLLLCLDLEKDTQQIADLLTDASKFHQMQQKAVQWSRTFTIDAFEKEIASLLINN